ncbi:MULTISPECIES: formyltransferase [unclassified Cupriavidus]|uniref:formyltransferase n=1 Tax=unclassified Cupriavidus TaxID=2640874 RepID=UPI001C007B28|nr:MULTISPECIES: formyltransferase [unclassified Cupriavidus]MCA3185867.1 formyltransferase [Cupriavidus sp.]MCA3192617.1 formyltransferase [Cupriavidus sp.]MCA3195239.1 formyltransferase [Cupriavidus sp.]MCA3205594.1 formyltransferase [Cupriavidus sp.]MCA3207160.1 formyltransferase [Cupriavidus sp.]
MRAVVFAYHNVGDRCLRVLHAQGVDVALVVTHRDRPDENIWFQRVADTAADLNLSFLYAEDPADPALAEAVRAARPDVIFSFYYRAMIPADVLAIAPQGAFNMHGSLLPKYRGRVPVNWAVLHGETETGATLHAMEAKPDAGYIVDQTAVPILPDDTAGQVFEKVTVAAEQTLWRALPAMKAGQTPKRPNRLADGSYFSGRKPEDGRIDFSQPAAAVYNLIRAVAPPYPGAFTDIAGRRFIVAQARRLEGGTVPAGLRPGLQVLDGRIVAVCGDGGALRVLQLLEGSSADHASPVSATEFQNIIPAQS